MALDPDPSHPYSTCSTKCQLFCYECAVKMTWVWNKKRWTEMDNIDNTEYNTTVYYHIWSKDYR